MPLLNTHGARVSYSRTGTGEAVLLIQGVGAIGNAWRPQVEALSQHYSVITFDNRGIGASTITEGSLTIEGMAEDALTILNAEGVNRCHVVGHSMGGLIAAQLALMWPRRVKSLALLCTFPDGKSGSRLTRDTFFAGLRTRIGTRAMRRKAFLSLVLSKAGMDGAARPALEATIGLHAAAVHAHLAGAHDLVDQRAWRPLEIPQEEVVQPLAFPVFGNADGPGLCRRTAGGLIGGVHARL